jgi:hypothetical protein
MQLQALVGLGWGTAAAAAAAAAGISKPDSSKPDMQQQAQAKPMLSGGNYACTNRHHTLQLQTHDPLTLM